MEIALLTKSGLRIKTKQATIAFDPQDKTIYNAVLVLGKSVDEITKPEAGGVLILGVGEFEVGGVKITGIRSEADMVYSLIADSVSILVGKLNSLDKLQHKLKEHNIVIVNCDVEGTSSFITSLADQVVIFYGEKAAEVSASFGKENVKQMPKYSTTKDKLPTEIETILLA